jgi:hypothetical protein
LVNLTQAVTASRPRRIGDGGRRMARLSVNETDRVSRARQTDSAGDSAGIRMPHRFRPNLNLFRGDLRLEHELQTACEAAAWRRREFAITDGYRAVQCGGTDCRH